MKTDKGKLKGFIFAEDMDSIPEGSEDKIIFIEKPDDPYIKKSEFDDVIKTDGDGDKFLSDDGTYIEPAPAVEIDNTTIVKNINEELSVSDSIRPKIKVWG